MAKKKNTEDTAEETATFESRLAELEEIVQQLEAGEKPLDESLALYERGIAALKLCHRTLDDAELRIKRIMRAPDGRISLEEIAPEELDSTPAIE